MPIAHYLLPVNTQPDPVEGELVKDIWDVRHLPGVRFTAHRSDYRLNFTILPDLFRPMFKRYFRLLITRNSLSDCSRRLRYLRDFVEFYLKLTPSARDFQELNRSHIEAFLFHLSMKTGRHGQPFSQEHRWRTINGLRHFLGYLEQTESPECPKIPIGKLIWPSDAGDGPRNKPKGAKYIPESVLLQLEQHMHLLPSAYLPVVIILRASGWRIADVLNLRYDTCLERTSSGWWLCGDILKTQVLGHKVPISDEIAGLITAQCSLVQEHFSEEDNPKRYLFPAKDARRRGYPMKSSMVQYALNRLAHKQGISDETGKIFHFKTHAFRHTKAVELINGGMSLIHVQKWMAHLSPEMTLVYAQILDSTFRQEWEQAFAKGAVRIDRAGAPKAVTTEELNNEEEIEWAYIRHNLDAVRLPNGYCFKPKKALCPTQDTPCYTCHHFCTTPSFLSQLEREEREMRELIDLGERAGSPIWVERNTQKLERLLPVIGVLKQGTLHHPAGKAVREYSQEERVKRNEQK